jgi:hypothetical protein
MYKPIRTTDLRPTPAALAYSVNDFCALHHISRAYFYKILNLGIGPRIMTVGGRKLISHEAATDWRREREQNVAA